MIPKVFIFYFSLVFCATHSSLIAESEFSLGEFQEQILSKQRNRKGDYIRIKLTPIHDIPSRKLLKDMKLMDETAFILFWYSYGYLVKLTTKTTGWSFINAITTEKGQGRAIFKEMKEGFFMHLNKTLLEEMVSTNRNLSAEEKKELLYQAMDLYYSRFHSIWIRIAKPTGTERFDNLRPTFSFLLRVINQTIYDSLNFTFVQIFDNLFNPDDKILYSYKRQFHYLAQILSKDENENRGLRWVANHNNPFFIFTYFYYYDFLPDRKATFLKYIITKDEIRIREFELVLKDFQKMLNYSFKLKNNKLKFAPNFKSPFPPQVMETAELKSIISKIISKLVLFCF
jgi:hypothetical protein